MWTKFFQSTLASLMKKHIQVARRGSGLANNWIAPKKTEDLYGGSRKPKRKKPKSLSLNNTLLQKINKTVPRNKRSAFIDMVLSKHFGINYCDAYPEAYGKAYGEERGWDIEGQYRRADIETPGRFSSKKKRKKEITFYKNWMARIR